MRTECSVNDWMKKVEIEISQSRNEKFEEIFRWNALDYGEWICCHGRDKFMNSEIMDLVKRKT